MRHFVFTCRCPSRRSAATNWVRATVLRPALKCASPILPSSCARFTASSPFTPCFSAVSIAARYSASASSSAASRSARSAALNRYSSALIQSSALAKWYASIA